MTAERNRPTASPPRTPCTRRRLGIAAVFLCLWSASPAAGPGAAADASERLMTYISDGSETVSSPDPWWSYRSPCPSLTTWSNNIDYATARQRAIECREKVLQAAIEAGRRQETVLVLAELAKAYIVESPKSGRDLIDRALEIVRERRQGCWEAYLVEAQARYHSHLADIRRLYAQTVTIAREHGCSLELATGLYSLALYPPGNDPLVAVELLEEAVLHARTVADPYLLRLIQGTLAIHYVKLGDRRAIALWEEVVANLHAVGDRQREMMATWNLGIALDDLDEPALAVEHLVAYIAFEKKRGHPTDRPERRLAAVRRKIASR